HLSMPPLFPSPTLFRSVRTGSLVLDYKEDKLYVSVVFLEQLGFNLISEEEENFYLAVIDIPSLTFEKIIQYHGTKTVGFYVSERSEEHTSELQSRFDLV